MVLCYNHFFCSYGISFTGRRDRNDLQLIGSANYAKYTIDLTPGSQTRDNKVEAPYLIVKQFFCFFFSNDSHFKNRPFYTNRTIPYNISSGTGKKYLFLQFSNDLSTSKTEDHFIPIEPSPIISHPEMDEILIFTIFQWPWGPIPGSYRPAPIGLLSEWTLKNNYVQLWIHWQIKHFCIRIYEQSGTHFYCQNITY